MSRPLAARMAQSYPEDFDIIATQNFTAGDVLEHGMVVYVTAKDNTASALPADASLNQNYVISQETTLAAGDAVTLVGYQRSYIGIDMAKDAQFNNDSTSVIVNGHGKNMSVLNGSTGIVWGTFDKVVIPATATDTIIIAYR